MPLSHILCAKDLHMEAFTKAQLPSGERTNPFRSKGEPYKETPFTSSVSNL